MEKLCWAWLVCSGVRSLWKLRLLSMDWLSCWSPANELFMVLAPRKLLSDMDAGICCCCCSCCCCWCCCCCCREEACEFGWGLKRCGIGGWAGCMNGGCWYMPCLNGKAMSWGNCESWTRGVHRKNLRERLLFLKNLREKQLTHPKTQIGFFFDVQSRPLPPQKNLFLKDFFSIKMFIIRFYI